MAKTTKLRVLFDSRTCGWLESDAAAPEEFHFTYADTWLFRKDAVPISISMPLQPEPFSTEISRAWFDGLLPEGRLRDAICEQCGIAPRDTLSLLSRYGRECAGAIGILPLESEDPAEDADLRGHEVSDLLNEFCSPRGEGILMLKARSASLLSGAQQKLPVYWNTSTKHIGTLSPGRPSTYIIKPDSKKRPGLARNEFLCMKLAAGIGMNVAQTGLWRGDAGEAILSLRFDRSYNAAQDWMTLCHQEDLCQAMSLEPVWKYQRHGRYHGMATIADTLRKAGVHSGRNAIPLEDELYRRCVFNYLVGNGNAHAKKWAVLRRWQEALPELAPMYDIVCTEVYSELGGSFAMSYGRHYTRSDIDMDDMRRLAREVGSNPDRAGDVLAELAGRCLGALPRVMEQTVRRVGDHLMLRIVAEHIENNCHEALEMYRKDKPRISMMGI